jgi:hypothetical protein
MRGSNRRRSAPRAVSRKSCGIPTPTGKTCARWSRGTASIREIALSRGVQRGLGAMKTQLPDEDGCEAFEEPGGMLRFGIPDYLRCGVECQ